MAMSTAPPKPFLCRIGLHHYVDFPDPNTESGGLEKQGYLACTRCTKEKDKRTYLSRSGKRRLPSARQPAKPEGQPLAQRKKR
jgi:hypothetical protein